MDPRWIFNFIKLLKQIKEELLISRHYCLYKFYTHQNHNHCKPAVENYQVLIRQLH
ncbi:hypothetical protein GCD22_03642 [Acidithiobacillus thiooxidans ATCC 19377]|uniref:Uncharacterized protein n=1 Tax=Acidithiobacillus thiooxidans ATCC 19377 TaxID=637390 RepID=A0A5P9XWC4_ACITH|nr:hypothetical protein GCD22_03642 [Acidithiobacillus thiooxidans ATCC 19377]